MQAVFADAEAEEGMTEMERIHQEINLAESYTGPDARKMRSTSTRCNWT